MISNTVMHEGGKVVGVLFNPVAGDEDAGKDPKVRILFFFHLLYAWLMFFQTVIRDGEALPSAT